MTHYDRRAFLGASVAGLTGLALPATGTAAGAPRPAPPLIDTHTHFYDPTRPAGVPWPAREDRLLYRPVLPEHFRRLTRPLGVTGNVAVEASPWVEDNQWLLDLADRDTVILGVVGRLLPAGDDFARDLRRFARHPRFRGIRITGAELQQGLERRPFRHAMGLLAENDLALDVNGGPALPPDVARLARQQPDLRVVINHAANVPVDGRAVPRDWLRGMTAAAERPNVYCKASALVEGTGRNAGNAPRDGAHYRPVLDALWEAFGADRLLYGSNWPVSERSAGYDVVLRIVRDYFAGKGPRARDKFFALNAAAVYKWPRR
jgi:predicted TIM-barrel fold metal-dependent hydrolase